MESADPAHPATRSSDSLPPLILAALDGPPPSRRGWDRALAPQLIALFLWVVFFDQVPLESIPRTGVAWPIAGAVVGGLLSALILYYVPTIWSFWTGKPLVVVACATFGVKGASWVPGLLLAVIQVVWMATSVFYATELGTRGLVLIQLLDARTLRPLIVGGYALVSPLFMVTAFSWCLAAALVGRYLVRVISALMNIYPILPALILGAGLAAALTGLPEYRPAQTIPPAVDPSAPHPGMLVFLATIQLVLGFFASAGLAAGDWGAACRTERDVRYGGAVGVAMASSVIATIAVLTVAGSVGRFGPPVDPIGIGMTGAYTFHAALIPLFGHRVAGMMYLALGLASLAPTCYAAYLFGTRMHELRPRLSRTKWTLVAVGLASPLIVLGVGSRLATVFGFVGALVAPAAGAMAADYVRSRGKWPGARIGVNRPGMLAWAGGVCAGLAPFPARWLGWDRLADAQPSVLFAFMIAFVVYLTLAKMLGESAVDGRPELSSVVEASASAS